MRKDCRLTFRLSNELCDDLIRFALAENVSLSKAIRTLIEDRKRKAA